MLLYKSQNWEILLYPQQIQIFCSYLVKKLIQIKLGSNKRSCFRKDLPPKTERSVFVLFPSVKNWLNIPYLKFYLPTMRPLKKVEKQLL